jgi:hypothetical protein
VTWHAAYLAAFVALGLVACDLPLPQPGPVEPSPNVAPPPDDVPLRIDSTTGLVRYSAWRDGAWVDVGWFEAGTLVGFVVWTCDGPTPWDVEEAAEDLALAVDIEILELEAEPDA